MLEEVRYKVLVISLSDKINETIDKLLDKNKFVPPDFTRSSSQGRRLLLERHYDVVIINSPLSENNETTLALEIKEKYDVGVILLSQEYNYDEFYDKVHSYGVFCLAKPTSKMLFLQTLQLIISSYKDYQNFKDHQYKNASLKQKMAEVRVVAEAKLLLMKREKIDEDEAHKYLLTYAMNHGLSKLEAANKIIANEEKGLK